MKHRSWTDYRVHAFSRPAVERLQTRGRRRTLVLVGLLNKLGIVLVCWVWPTAWWVWAPMFVLLFPLASLLNMSVRGVTEIPLANLDDRQAQLRMKAFHDAFPIAIAIALLTGIALGHVWLGHVWLANPSPPTSLAFGTILGTIGASLHKLPTTILAWRLPEEVDDGDAL